MKSKKLILLGSLVAALVLGMCIVPAWAYFTDSETAEGSLAISFRPTTDIEEEYDQGVKHVVITNKADSTEAVVVRARAFSPVDYTASGAGWTRASSANDVWCYYGQVIQPGGQSAELTVELPKFATVEGQPKDSDFGENYNVVVVYEALPASQATVDGSGNVTKFPAEWE